MAWKPIRAEPGPQSKYMIFHRCEDGSEYYLTSVTADSGMVIQDVVKLVCEGYANGTARRAGLYKIRGGWHAMYDLDYREEPILPDEQLGLDLHEITPASVPAWRKL